MKSNIEIIQEVIEQVVNQKKIKKWDLFFSQDYMAHGAPYLGIGYSTKKVGYKLIINFIVPGSPAEGNLQEGDELLWGEDERQRWGNVKALSQAIGRGQRGSIFKLAVRRGDETLEFELAKGPFHVDTGCKQAKAEMKIFMTKVVPDLQATIDLIFGDGDMVVCLMTYSGTHATYKREAIWREAWITRLSAGMIVESWPVNDESSFLRQIGYKLVPPKV